MRIRFIGVKPSAALEKVLLANGFDFEVSTKFPKTKLTDTDLLAFAPKATSDLKSVESLRRLAPLTWIAIVVKKAQFNDHRVMNDLLKCEGKNEVWLAEHWELNFWISLQAAIGFRRDRADNLALKKENRELKEQVDELLTRSKKLVEQLEKDVDLAFNIQRSILPKVSPHIPGISLAVKYLPAAGLGGDYYDIFEFGDRKRFGILLADSKTHGMAAALLGVLLKVRLEEMKDRFPDSQSFVEFINREILEHQKNLAALSLLYGIFDRSTLTFSFTSAGNLRPILWRAGKAVPVEIAGNPALGGTTQFAFRENQVTLSPGDLLVFFTDGLDTALGNAQKKLLEVLKTKSASPHPLEIQNELIATINQTVEKKSLKDDITLIHFSVDERALYVAK